MSTITERQRQLCLDLETLWRDCADLTTSQRFAAFVGVAGGLAGRGRPAEYVADLFRALACDEERAGNGYD